MVWFPCVWLEEVEAFASGGATIVTAGRLAAAAMLALLIRNLRRDVDALLVIRGSSKYSGGLSAVTLFPSLLRRFVHRRNLIARVTSSRMTAA
jgi:hypothetical protein